MRLPFRFRGRSLTSKLLGGTLAVLSGYVIAIGILAYLSAKNSIADAYDESLIVNANALLFLMQEEVAEGGLNKPLSFDISVENLKGEDKSIFTAMAEYRMFRVWHNGKLILTSNRSLPASIPAFPEGFSDQKDTDGDIWRIYALYAPKKGLIVELGEQDNSRQTLVWRIAQDLVLPFLISLPLVALMFWRAIRKGMRDLHKVTRQVNIRSPEQMTPLETAKLPPDLLPLVEAINALLNRLDRSLLRERQITELAAHELRTPLTAIKLQAQMGLKAADDAARIKALHGLLEGVERAAHLVEQLLTLTRVEQTEFKLYDLDAGEVAERVVSELRPLSDRRGQQLRLSLDNSLTVHGNEDLLYLTLTNIIGNAIKYSPQNSKISIRGAGNPDETRFEIGDDGPGIPEEVREKIFERFFRYHTGKALGSGLGLTIARQCAEHMGASLSLNTPATGRGLEVRLTLQASNGR